ncbi:MAG: hypothetical protein ABFD91_03810 [Anaerohalosphaeraceae bacterium]
MQKTPSKILLIINTIIVMSCFVMSWNMVDLLSTKGISIALTTYKDLLVCPILVISCISAVFGFAMILIGFAKKTTRQMYFYIVLLLISTVTIRNSLCFLNNSSFPDTNVTCQVRLRRLLEAMYDYSAVNKTFPCADQWCDLLIERSKVNKDVYPEYFNYSFVCPGRNKGRCHYALNQNVTIHSDGDVVCLFDSKEGWNLYGGKELLDCDNHEGKGCNVVFVNGKSLFIEKDKLDDLKWQ